MFQWAVSRSQNSYNSGLWQDYIVERVENQRKIWLPTNPVTDKIWYDTRVFIDSNFAIEGESVAWKVSKVERTAPLGVSKFTMTQELYDNEDWSARLIDTYETTDQPDVTLGLDYYWTGRIDGVGFDSLGKSEIKYSGKGTIRVGYSKKFTAHFYNSEEGMDISEKAVPQWEIVLPDGTEVVDFDQLENLTCKLDESGDELTVKENEISVLRARLEKFEGKAEKVEAAPAIEEEAAPAPKKCAAKKAPAKKAPAKKAPAKKAAEEK